VAGGVVPVDVGSEPEEDVHADAVQVRDERRQICGSGPCDPGELGVEGHEPPGLDCRLVHAGRVVVAGLDAVDVAGRCRALEDAAERLEVALLELGEPTPALPVGRHGIGRHPAAARELVEVGAGAGVPIQIRQLEARGAAQAA
jgi:hypothetical protein